MIFWGHYVDWIITGPMLIACLAMLSKSDLVTLVFMMVRVDIVTYLSREHVLALSS